MQELINLRTRHWKHFDTGERWIDEHGVEHIICKGVNQRGQHYDDGTGWQNYDGNIEYDTTLDDKGKQYGHKVKKAQHNLRISNGKVRFGFAKGVFVEYGIPDLPADVVGNTYTVPGSWLNSDLVHTVSPEGVKNDIILKAPGHPSAFSFPVSTMGCTPQREGSTLVFYHNGNPVGSIPAPYAEDANGDRGAVALDYDGVSVRFVPDPIWLASAVYPVRVDPTTVIQPDPTAGKDDQIAETNVTGNWGTATSMTTGVYDTTAKRYRSLYQYDLSSVPSSSVVNSAVLSLYCSSGINTSAQVLSANKITAAWGELTVNWSNQPTFDATASGSASVGAYNAWYDWAITSLAAFWVANPASNYGVIIKASNEATINTYKTFWSSDYTTDITLRPKLTITYTVAPASNLASVFGSINALGRRLIA